MAVRIDNFTRAWTRLVGHDQSIALRERRKKHVTGSRCPVIERINGRPGAHPEVGDGGPLLLERLIQTRSLAFGLLELAVALSESASQLLEPARRDRDRVRVLVEPLAALTERGSGVLGAAERLQPLVLEPRELDLLLGEQRVALGELAAQVVELAGGVRNPPVVSSSRLRVSRRAAVASSPRRCASSRSFSSLVSSSFSR